MEARLDYSSLEEALSDAAHSSLMASRPVGGGDINRARVLELVSGDRLFLKENTISDPAFFRAEAGGLQALAEANAVRTPRVLGVGHLDSPGEGRGTFLLLEYLESAPKKKNFWEDLGHGLAALHLYRGRGADRERFGFFTDNIIGATPQKNDLRGCWIDFFSDCRIRPQIALASSKGLLDRDLRGQIEGILDRLEDYFIEPEYPSLIHGDLWSGNFMAGPDGEPVLIDPAVSWSHREADLAMTELFGGFPRHFYEAYSESFPLQAGYEERRDLYNLYHMLNHVNLFGQAYTGSVRAIIRNYM